MATATITSGAGDGWVIASNASWDTAHDATTGGTADYTTSPAVPVETGKDAVPNFRIVRGFYVFDLSTIPAGATIKSATFKVYITATPDNGDNDGDDWVNVVQTTQASTTEIVTADFNQCGAVDDPTEGATRIDIGDLSETAYNTWTLDSTGLGWVTTEIGSTLKLGLREGHDALDNPYAGSDNTQNRFAANFSESVSNKPTLTVEYSTGADLQGYFNV